MRQVGHVFLEPLAIQANTFVTRRFNFRTH